MASYPNAVKTFTTKSDGAGNKIFASHINDLQDEVNAIEAGLLNGTAPLNSSGSTVNTLSVSSNSTFGGIATFTNRPLEPPPEMALVRLPSTVAVGSSSFSTLSFTAETFVTNSSMHSTASNPSRLIPQSTGVYQFTAQIGMSAAGSGVRQVQIQDSSGVDIASLRVSESTGFDVIVQATGYKRFDALGSYCVVVTAMSGNSTMSLSSGSWFAMVKL